MMRNGRRVTRADKLAKAKIMFGKVATVRYRYEVMVDDPNVDMAYLDLHIEALVLMETLLEELLSSYGLTMEEVMNV